MFFEHYFQNMRARGKGDVKVLCPFHEDKNPSCSISLTKGTWYCHAACGGGGIIAFEQRKNGGSWEQARERVAHVIGHRVGKVEREIATVYAWTDEKGKLVYEHVRYEPKDFRWRRPDGKGGYTWKLGGVRRVLYNLPKVVKAERVILCEGEKDVETLQALGLTATTSGDAPNSWRGEFAEFLTGKDVVLVPDNDAPGRELMEHAARSLYGVAR
jgi:DNA primase